MKKNPETCAVRATALQEELGRRLATEKTAAARATAEASRSAMLHEYAPIATWRGSFKEAARRFLVCAAAGGAPHAEWAVLLGGLRPLCEEDGVPTDSDRRPFWAAAIARERHALAPLGGKQQSPTTADELQSILDAAWAAADRERDAFGPTHGFESWDGRLCCTPRPDGLVWFTSGNAGWIWSAGGRSVPFLRHLGGDQWEAGIAASRWLLNGNSAKLNSLGVYDSAGAPLPPETWAWRCEPLRS
jgi:hypothetical protein